MYSTYKVLTYSKQGQKYFVTSTYHYLEEIWVYGFYSAKEAHVCRDHNGAGMWKPKQL